MRHNPEDHCWGDTCGPGCGYTHSCNCNCPECVAADAKPAKEGDRLRNRKMTAEYQAAAWGEPLPRADDRIDRGAGLPTCAVCGADTHNTVGAIEGLCAQCREKDLREEIRQLRTVNERLVNERNDYAARLRKVGGHNQSDLEGLCGTCGGRPHAHTNSGGSDDDAHKG